MSKRGSRGSPVDRMTGEGWTASFGIKRAGKSIKAAP